MRHRLYVTNFMLLPVLKFEQEIYGCYYQVLVEFFLRILVNVIISLRFILTVVWNALIVGVP